jgi:MoxR-like ATPase
VQFTADLMPSDLSGVSVYDRGKEGFIFHPGPIFAQVLLADEINRASPKTQSALLEAMEEKQVTVEGETRALPSPFFVIATQNPHDQLGTFALPESQLDRFLMRISLGYPDRAAERRCCPAPTGATWWNTWATRCRRSTCRLLQQQVLEVHAADPLLDYVQDLVAATRSGRWFLQGLSPRAGIAVIRAAKAQALLSGRDYVAPDDVQAILPQTVAHRLMPGRRRRPRPGRAGARDGGGRAAAMRGVERQAFGVERGSSRARRPTPDAQPGVLRAPPLPPVVAGPPAAVRHADADPAQRLHPADAARLMLGPRCWCCWSRRSTTS